METFSALLAICTGNLPVTGEFLSQRPVTRKFDVFFDLHLNKRLSKQSKRRWFETPSHILWRHRNACDILMRWRGWQPAWFVLSESSYSRNRSMFRCRAVYNTRLSVNCHLRGYGPTRRSVIETRTGTGTCLECGLQFTLNTLRPRQNGRHFPDDILKCIFVNENVLISINISLKFVPKGQMNNIPALV